MDTDTLQGAAAPGPVELSDLAPPAPATPAANNTDAPTVAALNKKVDLLTEELRLEREERRFFSQRQEQNRGTDREPADDADEPPPADEPEETPEELLDAISKDGLKALKVRGFVSKSELQALLRESEQRAVERVEGASKARDFETTMGEEFPELLADAEAVAAGRAPSSDLYRSTQRIYKETIRMDPTLARSPGALLMAARQAAAELGDKRTPPGDRRGAPRTSRRTRIEGQDFRTQSRPEQGDHARVATDLQLTVAKNLGVDPSVYSKGGQ